MSRDSYDVIAGAVKDYWRKTYPQDVIAFFSQKYSWENKWERCEELVECNGADDYDRLTFLSDFCEGQTDVKDVVIVPLREVTAFYSSKHQKLHTNADRIRSMTDEELARFIARNAGRYCDDKDPEDEEYERILPWLKSPVEVDNG